MRMTGCLAGRARAFGPTSCCTASASSAPRPRPGHDMLTTLPLGEGSSHYVHTAIKSRSLNGHGADFADTPGTWTIMHGTVWWHTVLRAVRRSRARRDIQRRSRLRVVHSYCLCIWNFATLPPFYWCATAGPRACSLLETVHSRIRGLHTWTVWVVSLTDGTMVACAIIVCTPPRVCVHSIVRG